MTVGYAASVAFLTAALAVSAPANAAMLLTENLSATNGDFSRASIDTQGMSGSSDVFVSAHAAAASENSFGPAIQHIIASVTAIPEPNTWSLMVAGFGIAGILIRRRRVELVSFS